MSALRTIFRNAVSLNGVLPANARRQREILLVLSVCLVLCHLLHIAISMQRPQTALVSFVVMFTSIFTAFTVLSHRNFSENMLKAYGSAYLFFIATLDITARSSFGENWALFVLVTDFFLVFRLDSFATRSVLLVLGWTLLMGLERHFRFGLLDIPVITTSQSYRTELMIEASNCATIPCSISIMGVLAESMEPLCVCVIDVIITRRFAQQVEREQNAMERTISTVEEITRLLARYDVDAVADMLEASKGELPDMMFLALRQMEGNLRAYKPFLPAALFEAMNEEEEDAETDFFRTQIPAPGQLGAYVTIVFTDIRCSTSVWETAPEGMRHGLRAHNSLIRNVISQYQGYEVKTIGDAFMVAFESTKSGLRFALSVHEGLFAAEWPPQLLDVPVCSVQGSLYRGLNLRIGVNSGAVNLEANTMTGRTDYFGHTVNVASRLESVCLPGAVAIPLDLWVTEYDSIAVHSVEKLSLKGISSEMWVSFVWPMSLAGRKGTPLNEAAGSSHLYLTAYTMTRCDSSSYCSSHGSPGQNGGGVFTSPAFASPLALGDKKQSFSDVVVVAGQKAKCTVGTVEIWLGDVGTLSDVSAGVDAVQTGLDQSGGTAVALLANRMCIAWNVGRKAPSHAETALRFAARFSTLNHIEAIGLASGTVHHGNVGARKQIYMTILGAVVFNSWTLCTRAQLESLFCLYAPPAGATLHAALMTYLTLPEGKDDDTGVYQLKEQNEES